MIIADTCLIFHLFNETSLTGLAQSILVKDSHWVFPHLWREEYANVLSKLARKEKRAISDVVAHFTSIVEELQDCEIQVDTKNALQISLEYKISVYDAHFIALALDFDTLLITEDKEILKCCPNLALTFKDFLNKKSTI